MNFNLHGRGINPPEDIVISACERLDLHEGDALLLLTTYDGVEYPLFVVRLDMNEHSFKYPTPVFVKEFLEKYPDRPVGVTFGLCSECLEISSQANVLLKEV